MHGLEPGHGWPVAALYSLERRPRYVFGLISAGIIAFFHLISSVAVVGVFILFKESLGLESMAWTYYLAAAALLALAVYMWRQDGHHHHHDGDHGHDHDHQHAHGHSHVQGPSLDPEKTTLWGIAVFAFALGFIHEEEFALLALCLGNLQCLGMMLTYALAVTVALIGLTLGSIATVNRLEDRFEQVTRYLPKVSAVILVGMAVLYLVRAF